MLRRSKDMLISSAEKFIRQVADHTKMQWFHQARLWGRLPRRFGNLIWALIIKATRSILCGVVVCSRFRWWATATLDPTGRERTLDDQSCGSFNQVVNMESSSLRI